MSEESSGSSTAPPPQGMSLKMTAGEEEAIVACYGVRRPFDSDLQWTVTNRQRLTADDDPVFLTEGVGDEYEAEAEVERVEMIPTVSADTLTTDHRAALRDPLDLFFFKNIPGSFYEGPLSVLEEVHSAVSRIEGRSTPSTHRRGGDEPGATERMQSVLNDARAMEARFTLVAEGASISEIASRLVTDALAPLSIREVDGEINENDSSDPNTLKNAAAERQHTSLLHRADELLQEAEQWLGQDIAPCGQVGDSIAALLEAERQRVLTEMGLLVEDECDEYWIHNDIEESATQQAERVELLEQARIRRARLESLLKESSMFDPSEEAEVAEHPANIEEMHSSTAQHQSSPASSSDDLTVPWLESIYAFEMELPLDRRAALETSSPLPVLRACEVQLPSLFDMEEAVWSSARPSHVAAGLPIPDMDTLPPLEELLKHIAESDLRDTVMLNRSNDVLRQTIEAKRQVLQQQWGYRELSQRDPNDGEFLKSLSTFHDRVDELLAPTTAEIEERASLFAKVEGDSLVKAKNLQITAPATTSSQHVSGPCSAPVSATAVVKTEASNNSTFSLENIQRKAAMELFFVSREAEETRQLRREDTLAEERIQIQAAKLSAATQAVQNCMTEALQTLVGLRRAESDAYEDLMLMRQRDQVMVTQLVSLRQLQAIEQFAYALDVEQGLVRSRIADEEKELWQKLAASAQAQVEAVAAELQRREKERTAAEKEKFTAAKARFTEEVNRRLYSALKGATDSADGAVTGRASVSEDAWYQIRFLPLQEEVKLLTRWLATEAAELKNAYRLLVEGTQHYMKQCSDSARLSRAASLASSRTEPLWLSGAPGSLSPRFRDEGRSPLSLSSLSLNYRTFQRLLWPTIEAAQRDPRRTRHYFSSLSFALDDLHRVEWEELARMAIPAVTTEVEKSTTAANPRDAEVYIAPSLQNLDLSSNPLQHFQLQEALQTFPQLQELRVTNANLVSLFPSSVSESTGGEKERPSSSRHIRNVVAARESALAQHTMLHVVDLSSNQLSSLAPLGAVTAGSLVCCTAVGNALTSIADIAPCSSLQELSVSHNRITSIAELAALPLLQELDIGDNAIVDLGAAVDQLLLLQKLYASHNAIRHLSLSAMPVALFLTQLFVNHNQLTSLDDATVPWMPFLAVLQAEGNQLISVSGLRHCPRLRAAKLSMNRLATLDDLTPLRSCPMLETLDLTGNPVFLPNLSELQRASLSRDLVQCLPSLCELNNEVVSRKPEAGGAVPYEAEQEQRTHGCERLLCFVPSHEAYRSIFPLLCWDRHIRHCREDMEVRQAHALRAIHRARSAACGETRNEAREEHSNPVRPFSDSTIYYLALRDSERRYRMLRCTQLQNLLEEWQLFSPVEENGKKGAALPRHSASQLFANHHVRHAAYEERESEHLRKVAREFLCEWLLSRVEIRRAQTQLKALKTAFQKSEIYRRTQAALKIQPVWRGAALRSRLRRILRVESLFSKKRKGSLVFEDDDDETAYQKVDVEELMPSDVDPMPLEAILQQVVSAPGSDLPAFAVPLPPPPQRLTVANDSSSSRRQLEDGQNSLRGPSSASLSSSALSSERSSRRQHGNGESLEEQWGPAVAAQIRKKKQKQNVAHAAQLRREFMLDPLNTKKHIMSSRRSK